MAPLNPDAGLEPGRRLLTPQREEEGTTQGALTPTRHLRSQNNGHGGEACYDLGAVEGLALRRGLLLSVGSAWAPANLASIRWAAAIPVTMM